MKNNYLVSVFVDGKNVDVYYSEKLSDLAVTKALNRGCEIEVFDLINCTQWSTEQVKREIKKLAPSVILSSSKKEEDPFSDPIEKPPQLKKKNKNKKYWDRPIKCVETGKVYASIKSCSESLDIPYKAIWNAINSGNARYGFHFINVEKKEIHDM